jgi:hypothetical protein
MTKEELEKIEEAARWQENYDKQLKDIKKLHKACHKWFMRWREAKKDALYFDSSLQKQIEATLNLQKELNALRESIKDYGAGCYENGLRNGRRATEKDIERQGELLEKATELLRKWVELYKPKLEGYPITPIQEQTEQFLSEVEK